MNNQKNILITFDYELFLGSKSGHCSKCMLEPTELLLDVLLQNNAKSIFFVDILYLFRLKNENNSKTNEDYLKICQQLQKIKQLGHDIFCHLHPHWLNAVYLPTTNEWNLNDISKYRFHNLSDFEKNFVFEISNSLFYEILGENTAMNGYRAGGLCIQPFEEFKPHFEKYKIENEFSVMPGFHQKVEIQYFDFKNTPKENVYNFENELLNVDINGKFKQFQITTLPNFKNYKLFWRKYWNKILWKMNIRHFGNGVALSGFPIENNGLDIASIENMDFFSKKYYWNYLEKNNYLHLISHPKAVNRHNISSFASFLKKAAQRFSINYDFRKI